VVAALGAGCGDDDDDPTAPASGGADDPGVARAQAVAEPFFEVPTSVGTDVPLSKKPPTGRSIVVVACNLPDCGLYADAIEAAAEPLGWEVTKLAFEPTPESILARVKEAISMEPDGIVVNAVARSTFEAALPDAIEQDIAFVTQSVPEDAVKDVVPPFVAVQQTIPDFARMGNILGNWIVADSGGQANAIALAYANFPISHTIIGAAIGAMEENCPDCEAEKVTVQATDIGQKLPALIVSELQRDPDINYVVLQDGSMAVGLDAALREAGMLDRVKVVGTNGNPQTTEATRAGDEHGYVQYSLKRTAYGALDALARHFNGDPIEQLEMPLQILTKETIGDRSDQEVLYDMPPDLHEQFSELWRVSP
jgi:ribose transport system substrate-binding protein